MAGADGADGVRRERVAEIQRGRILQATLEVCAQHGVADLTVGAVVKRAGVSRRTFYELYSSCDDCLLAAFDHAIMRAREPVLAACRERDDWREQMRAGLGALLAFLDAEPSCARVLIVDAAGAGAAVQNRRGEVLAELARAVDVGRKHSRWPGALPSLTATGLVGGALSVIHQRMLAPGQAPLTKLLGPLAAMLVLPYLGSEAAQAELRRRGAPSVVAQPRPADPFAGVNMRITYRTVRVLQAIAECPGASNKQVGMVAGADDQGQISKLLARLQRLGLIVNEGGGDQGVANAWHLTARGAALSRGTGEWVAGETCAVG